MRKKTSIAKLKKEGWVKTAAEIPAPIKEKPSEEIVISPEEIKSIFERMKWHKEIEAYCGEMGILPADLIEIHKRMVKMPNLSLKQGKEVKVQDFTKENSIGKPYNPMNNPLFLKKIGKNESK